MIAPLYLFVFAGLFTPGPNIILLTTSGARFGFQRTIPHLAGVILGSGFIAAVTAFGIGALLELYPALKLSLQILSSLWILWMAWQLINASTKSSQGNERPLSFIEAVLFQAANPKIWAVALSASAAFPAIYDPMREAIRLGSAFGGINFFVCIFWTYLGTLLATLLSSPRAWLIFRNIMALLLVASAGLIWI
jgi:threonine/homoserine/homoserine lactone efflux protein